MDRCVFFGGDSQTPQELHGLRMAHGSPASGPRMCHDGPFVDSSMIHMKWVTASEFSPNFQHVSWLFMINFSWHRCVLLRSCSELWWTLDIHWYPQCRCWGFYGDACHSNCSTQRQRCGEARNGQDDGNRHHPHVNSSEIGLIPLLEFSSNYFYIVLLLIGFVVVLFAGFYLLRTFPSWILIYTTLVYSCLFDFIVGYSPQMGVS